MTTKFILSVLVFIPVLIIKMTILPFIAWNQITPDIVVILLIFYSIIYGQVYGTLLGFIYGFLFDIITGGLLGSAMLSYTIAGFIGGYFSNENKRQTYFKPFNFGLIVLVCSIIASLLFSIFSTIDFSINIVTSLFEDGLLPSFYTSVIAIVLISFYPRRRLIDI